MTNLFTYNVDDASKEQWNKFIEFMENTDLEVMEAMDLDSQVNFFYNIFEEAAKGAFEVKEKFSKEVNDKRRYILKEVRRLLRRKQRLNNEILKHEKWW